MAENENIILLKVDFAFQYVMRNKRILASLIATILGIDESEITEVTLLQRELSKVHADDKLGILDVHAVIQQKRHINVELQMWWFKYWVERSEFYLFKMYVDQVKTGSKYENIEPCISISILNFTLFPEYLDFYSKFQLLNVKNQQQFTDKVEFHVLELPKLKYASKDEQKTKLYQWARMFTAESWEEYEEIGKEDPIMAEVIAELKEMSQDEIARYEYLHRQIALMDRAQEEDERRKYQEGLKEYQEGLKEYQKGLKEYQKGLKEFQQAKQEFQQERQLLQSEQQAFQSDQQKFQQEQQKFQRDQDALQSEQQALQQSKLQIQEEQQKVEEAKKKLVHQLLSMGLPIEQIQKNLELSEQQLLLWLNES